MVQRILRPLAYGDLLDECFDLYKKHFALFVGILAVAYIPFYALLIVAMIMLVGSAGTMTSTPHPQDAVPTSALLALALMGISVLVFIPLHLAANAASTWAIARTYLGLSATIADSYKAILPRIGALILTSILSAITIFIGLMMCGIPGILAGLLFAFVSQVFVVERLAYIPALQRSWRLAAYDLGRVFVVTFFASLLTFVISYALQVPFQLIGSIVDSGSNTGVLVILSYLAQYVGTALAAPLASIATVLLYYDIRVRKEGFDIEMLAAYMGHTTSETPVQPAGEANTTS